MKGIEMSKKTEILINRLKQEIELHERSARNLADILNESEEKFDYSGVKPETAKFLKGMKEQYEAREKRTIDANVKDLAEAKKIIEEAGGDYQEWVYEAFGKEFGEDEFQKFSGNALCKGSKWGI